MGYFMTPFEQMKKTFKHLQWYESVGVDRGDLSFVGIPQSSENMMVDSWGKYLPFLKLT